MKEISNLSVSDIMDLWRNCLEKALCILKFNMEGENGFDYDLKPEDEYDCNNCESPFCFKKMEWDDAQEFDNSSKTKLLTELEIEKPGVEILSNYEKELFGPAAIISYMDDYLKAYV